MDLVCRRYVVKGRVQGVFFRATTEAEARALGVCGHAVNLADGSVEVLAQGPRDALEKLEAFLHRGPPLARVDQVLCHDEPLKPGLTGFRTG